jgi:hypothetical protein
MMPVPIRRTFIETLSAMGPKTSMPSGIMTLDTIVKTDRTLPIKAASTVLCSRTMAGAFQSGNETPTNAIMTRYSGAKLMSAVLTASLVRFVV